MAKKERQCRDCGKMTMVKDVGEERRVYPGGREDVLCKTCQKARVDALIAATRKSLGLPDCGR